MAKRTTAYVKYGNVKQLQEAMGKYSFRFIFNPFPLKRSDPINSKWCVGIDYGCATAEMIEEFEQFWTRIETPIVETYKKPSLLQKLKRLLRSSL
jgi:hypothetical protein